MIHGAVDRQIRSHTAASQVGDDRKVPFLAPPATNRKEA